MVEGDPGTGEGVPGEGVCSDGVVPGVAAGAAYGTEEVEEGVVD